MDPRFFRRYIDILEAKNKKPEADTPELRKKQGRCVDCGQPLSTAGRGTEGRCRECEADAD
jgi:hypothetical protein